MSRPRAPSSESEPLTRLLKSIRSAGEVVLFALVAVSPWLLAGAEPAFEFILAAGVALLICLWASHASLAGKLRLRFDVLTAALAALAVLAALQLVPLPESVVGVVSPQRLAWHRGLIPAELEVLPGDTGPGAARPTWLPLTVAPDATRLFVARVVALMLVGLAVRNWLATRSSLDRLAWVLTVNGALLAFVSVAAFFGGPPDRIVWVFQSPASSSFGPFVCRNHFPDYAAVAMGFAVGLLLRRRESPGGWSAEWLTPGRLGLLVAVALMAVAVPFSLSRGGTLSLAGAGVLAWLLSRLPGRAEAAVERSPARLLVGAALALALLVTLWLGTGAVEARFGTLGDSGGLSSRLPLWRDAWRLAPSVWPAGTGAGTFVTAEPTVRGPETPALFYADHAHNDYLEALIEGGVPRLIVTVILALGAVGAVGRGYLARRNRSVGPRLLGLFFALVAVALHAGGDFALHMPAVALAAVVAAGFALAAARDERFVPPRVTVRRVSGSRSGFGSAAGDESEATLTGPLAGLVACGLALAAGLVALDLRAVARAERARGVADTLPVGSSARAGALAAAAELRPGDAATQYDAAQAYLDAAVAATPPGATGFAPREVAGPVRNAATHLLRAREADPLLGRVHGRLAVVAPYLAAGDAPRAYLDRAKALAPADPETWFAAGREALARGDLPQARADWREAAALSGSHQTRVLNALRGHGTPQESIAAVVPTDAARLLSAADALFPPGSPGRAGALESVAAAARRPGATADDALAEARAEAELGHDARAEAAWDAAISRGPERADIRAGYAAWLDARERYDDAIEQFEWLRRRVPNGYADPYARARRGARLAREIAAP